MIEPNTIGGRLLKFRHLQNLRQKDIALKIGIERNTYSEYENNKHKPSEKAIDKLVEVYHINQEWLLTGEGHYLLKDYTITENILNTEESMTKYNEETIVQLLEQNNRLVQQVSDLIKMQLLNAE